MFDEAVDADIAAAEAQRQELLGKKTPPATSAERPKCAALLQNLPRVDRHHESESTTCAYGCALKRIGEDISEKLDYTPGVFTVERWAYLRDVLHRLPTLRTFKLDDLLPHQWKPSHA